MIKKGDYIVYIDESGDSNLNNIDPKYPILVINFCCFKITEYLNFVDPILKKFKFDYFGHDQIILHETDIRKSKKSFEFLETDKDLKNNFFSNLSKIIEKIPLTIVPVIIDKVELKSQYNYPINPYYLGIRFGIERLNNFFLNENQEGKEISLVFEKRGRNEDENLEKEFSRICSKNEQFGYKQVDYSKMSYNLTFADKKSNSTGLQLADLIARPIGLNSLKPMQPNRAYDIISSKIYVNKKFPL